MTYFIIGKNEDKANLMFDSNQLGEESLGTFYPAQGFAALHNMIYKKPESLENFIIKLLYYRVFRCSRKIKNKKGLTLTQIIRNLGVQNE